MLTPHEMEMLTGGTAVTVIVAVLVAAALFRWQDNDIGELDAQLAEQDADLDVLWAWCIAAAHTLGWTDEDDQGPGEDNGPLPDEPDPTPPGDELADTAISHPADTFARKAALLGRYQHIGQHRSS